MGRTECAKCGQAVRGRRLCTPCDLDRRYGQGVEMDDKGDEDETVEIVVLQCADDDCGHEFEREATARRECPECGYYGHYHLDTKEAMVA